MNTKFFTVSWLQIKEALVVGFLTSIVVIIFEILAAKSIYIIDWKVLLNDAVIGFLTVIGTFLKSLLTTSNGNIVGLFKISK